MTKNIVFDIDGTLTEGNYLAKGITEYFKKPFDYTKMKNYSITQSIREQGILPLDGDIHFDEEEFFNSMNHAFENAQLIEGAKEFILSLYEENKDIIIVTARPPKLELLTKEYFQKHGLGNVADNIVLGKDGEHGKLNFVNEYFNNQQVTIFEDKPSTLVEFHTGGHNVVKVNQPYNMDVSFANRFKAINTYLDLK